MSSYTLKVKALYVVGSSNGIIERLSQDLSLLAARHGGKVVEPDPSAITSYLRWCVNLLGDDACLEREKQRIPDKYPDVSFVLEKSKLLEWQPRARKQLDFANGWITGFTHGVEKVRLAWVFSLTLTVEGRTS